MNMKIFVAGGTGRVGQRIVQQLSEATKTKDISGSSYSSDNSNAVNIKCLTRATSIKKAENLFQGLNNIEIKEINFDEKDKETLQKNLISSMEGCTTVICALGALESDALNWKAPYRYNFFPFYAPFYALMPYFIFSFFLSFFSLFPFKSYFTSFLLILSFSSFFCFLLFSFLLPTPQDRWEVKSRYNHCSCCCSECEEFYIGFLSRDR